MIITTTKSLFFTSSEVFDGLKYKLCEMLGLDISEVSLNPNIEDSCSVIPYIFVDDTKFEEIILPNIAKFKRKWIYISTSEFIHENIAKAYPYSVLNMSSNSKSISRELGVIINDFRVDYL